jgi:hypothetical protein
VYLSFVELLVFLTCFDRKTFETNFLFPSKLFLIVLLVAAFGAFVRTTSAISPGHVRVFLSCHVLRYRTVVCGSSVYYPRSRDSFGVRSTLSNTPKPTLSTIRSSRMLFVVTFAQYSPPNAFLEQPSYTIQVELSPIETAGSSSSIESRRCKNCLVDDSASSMGTFAL